MSLPSKLLVAIIKLNKFCLLMILASCTLKSCHVSHANLKAESAMNTYMLKWFLCRSLLLYMHLLAQLGHNFLPITTSNFMKEYQYQFIQIIYQFFILIHVHASGYMEYMQLHFSTGRYSEVKSVTRQHATGAIDLQIPKLITSFEYTCNSIKILGINYLTSYH